VELLDCLVAAARDPWRRDGAESPAAKLRRDLLRRAGLGAPSTIDALDLMRLHALSRHPGRAAELAGGEATSPL